MVTKNARQRYMEIKRTAFCGILVYGDCGDAGVTFYPKENSVPEWQPVLLKLCRHDTTVTIYDVEGEVMEEEEEWSFYIVLAHYTVEVVDFMDVICDSRHFIM